MLLEDFKSRMPTYAKDTKINLSNWLNVDQYPGLNRQQMLGVAKACAETLHSSELNDLVLEAGGGDLSDAEVEAACAAASIMAMNNIYYRALHLIEDSEVSRMPARLRMTVIGNPGVDKVDFELYCLAISAINGCGMCLKAHAQELTKQNVSKESIHSVLRIASIANAAAHVFKKIS